MLVITVLGRCQMEGPAAKRAPPEPCVASTRRQKSPIIFLVLPPGSVDVPVHPPTPYPSIQVPAQWEAR